MGGGDFTELRRRAWERLVAGGGRCAQAELEQAVFGASGGPLWARLLDEALAGEPRFRRGAEGWTLAGAGSAAAPSAVQPSAQPAPARPLESASPTASGYPPRLALPPRYAVLVVRATGARPERDRVTEVAVLVVEGGAVALTFHS